MEQTRADEDSRRVKRARISLACNSCREHKTRCDGSKPVCSHCQRRDPRSQIPCVYRTQARIRESQDMQDLLQRIKQLEGELAAKDSSNTDVDLGETRTYAGSRSNHISARQKDSVNRSPLSTSYLDYPARDNGVQTFDNGTAAFASLHPDTSDPFYRLEKSEAPTNKTSRFQDTQDRGDPDECKMSEKNRAFNSETVVNMRLSSVVYPNKGKDLPGGSKNQLLPSLSQQVKSPDMASDTSLTTHTSGPQEINEPYFYGEESTTTLIEEVNEIISPSGRFKESASVSSAPIYPSIKHNFRAFCIINDDDRNNLKDFDLPPRSLADHLVNCYFDRVHILYPFLHRPTFTSAYEKLWAPATPEDLYEKSVWPVEIGLGSSCYSVPNSRVFYCAINAMLALSCQFSDMKIQMVSQAAKVYLDRAMALLVSVDLLDNGSVSLVQVLLLLCLHLQSTPLRNRLWNIIGLAVRMAQGLGLQDEIGDHHEGGELHDNIPAEIRRRVWYACMMLDMTVGMTLGRNPIVSEGYTVAFPRPLSEENLHYPSSSLPNVSLPPQPEIALVSFFIEAIRLSELTSKMLKLLYARPTKTSQSTGGGKVVRTRDISIFMHLETTWNALFNNLPSKLRHADRSSAVKPRMQFEQESGYIQRQRNVLHARFLHVKILIYRPAFLQFCHNAKPRNKMSENSARPNELLAGLEATTATVKFSFLTHCTVACFQTAKDLIHLVHTTHGTKAASAWWYNIYYIYTSGVLIILSRHCLPLAQKVGIFAIEETWSSCQEILKNMKIYGAHAKRCLSSLEDLDVRLASWESASGPADESAKSAPFSGRMGDERAIMDSIFPKHLPSYNIGEELFSRKANPNQSWVGSENSEGANKDSKLLERDDNSHDSAQNDSNLEQEMAGMLPWDIDFKDWLTSSLDSTEFEDTTWPEMIDF